jgi:hypothetical protein
VNRLVGAEDFPGFCYHDHAVQRVDGLLGAVDQRNQTRLPVVDSWRRGLTKPLHTDNRRATP